MALKRPPRRPASAAGQVGARAGDAGEDGAVNDFLRVLEEHAQTCERTGKYAEAEAAKKRLMELRSYEEARRAEAIKARQLAEELGVEEAHAVEFKQLNDRWAERTADYHRKAGELEAAMRARHMQERDELERTTGESTLRPKFSRDLLNLRKIQQTLAKQKDYAEAHRIKIKADAVEAVELENLHIMEQGKLGCSRDKLLSKQQQELEALRERTKAGKEEQKRQHQRDMGRLMQRYHNIKGSMKKQHLKEMMALTGTGKHKRLGATGGSKVKRVEPFSPHSLNQNTPMASRNAVRRSQTPTAELVSGTLKKLSMSGAKSPTAKSHPLRQVLHTRF